MNAENCACSSAEAITCCYEKIAVSQIHSCRGLAERRANLTALIRILKDFDQILLYHECVTVPIRVGTGPACDAELEIALAGARDHSGSYFNDYTRRSLGIHGAPFRLGRFDIARRFVWLGADTDCAATILDVIPAIHIRTEVILKHDLRPGCRRGCIRTGSRRRVAGGDWRAADRRNGLPALRI